MHNGYADLHLHTVASDGTQRFDQLVRRARAKAICAIAVTDHDTVSPNLHDRVVFRHGVEVIAGVEVKARFGDVDGELLAYFVDPAHPRLWDLLRPLSVSRNERMRGMVALCRDHLGVEISEQEVRHVAGDGNIGRPHLARVLIDKGIVGSFREAFSTLIGNGCPCYQPIEKPDVQVAVDALKDAGGVLSVAHPCLMQIADWDGFLDRLQALGIEGLETVYPYDPASRTLSIDPKVLAVEARRRGFLVTGGSDDHGPGSTKESLGSIRLAYEHVDALRRHATW
jgi:3',5'-nucleoside bisphosphate phosphatase